MGELDPTVPATPETWPPAARVAAGERIDRFEVTGVLGAGGMGVVYEARDPDLDRRVAIKLIREPDTFHSLRLLREAQALARLQHPNVVAVHEVGRHGDQVFVAMERVDGVSLDQLSPRPRSWREVVRLFVEAGRGLVAAHDKGLIHRDVKPQNLLVGRDGRVRVGDFGLVRLAEPEAPASDTVEDPEPRGMSGTETTVERSGEGPPPANPVAGALGSPLTHVAAFLGTPRYMAPEQRERRPASARSDQFSFCVSMWETLFGEHPFDGTRRRPAPRGKAPRWLIAALDRGLAIDPERRHSTMAALVDVLERTPPRRRRIAIAVAAATVLAVVGTFSVYRVLQERDEAERERRLAQQHRAEAEELMDFMLFDLAEKLQPLGKLELLDAVAQKARGYYERRPATGAEQRRKRSVALTNVGDVLMAQGDASAALAAYREAFGIRKALAGAEPDDLSRARDLAYSHHKLGLALEAVGDGSGALAAYRTSLEIDQLLVSREPRNVQWQQDLASSHDKIGDVLMTVHGDPAGALVSFRASLAIRDRLVTEHPEHPDWSRWERRRSSSHDKIGEALLAAGATAAALAEFRTALAIVESLTAREPGNADWQQGLAISHAKVGNALLIQGDEAGALGAMQASEVVFARLAAQDPSDASRQRYLASIKSWVGDVQFSMGDTTAARDAFDASRAIYARLAALDPLNVDWQRDLAIGHEKVADVLLRDGDARGALATYHEAFEIVERMETIDPDTGRLQRMRAVYHDKIGDALRKVGDVDLALAEHRKGLALAEQYAAAQPDNAEWQRDVAFSHSKLGEVFVAKRDVTAAEQSYRAALAIMEKLAAQDPDNAVWADDIVQLRVALAGCCAR